MKKFNYKAAAEQALREMHKGLPDRIRIGHCYVFMRDGHDWHSDTVAVCERNQDGFMVARASDLCEQLLRPASKRRKIEMWNATSEELW